MSNQSKLDVMRPEGRRRMARIAIVAITIAGFGIAGLSGTLARHSDGWDDDIFSSGSGGSGGSGIDWDDDIFASGGSGGSGGIDWDDDWIFGSGGSGGSGWDD